VAARSTRRGTHQGEFMGRPATGKTITISGFDLARVAGGKIAEHWGMGDMLSLLRQRGGGVSAIPPAPRINRLSVLTT
jgi:predicted ester cyclase